MSQPVVKGALVECERCGVQRVMLNDLVLRVGVHDGRGAVRYRCRGCGEIRLRALSAEQTTSMASTKIEIEWWQPSRELREHTEDDAITDAEVGAWNDLLADDRAFTEVVSTLADSFG